MLPSKEMGKGRLSWLLAALALAAWAPPATADVTTAGDLELSRVADFSAPVHVAQPPGDTRRLFVVEKGGTIAVVRDGQKLGEPFLDISDLVLDQGERGLLSMAFAPDYPTSGRFYVYYTARAPVGEIHVEEFTRASEDRANRQSRRVVFTQEHAEFPNHNGGQLQIGPDGYLWMGLGDGGSSGDPHDNAQNTGTLLGKLLRIDPNPTSGGPYGFPPGNASGGRPEIFLYGLRNPWRFSFDRVSGDLTIGDVGQNEREEVTFIPAGQGAGANLGWDRCEGELSYPDTSSPCRLSGGNYVPPALTYPTPSPGSVTGGYVVRDRALPSLVGRYLYADFYEGDIRSAVLSTGRSEGDAATGLQVENLGSFAEDNQCRIFVASLAGPVYHLRARTPPAEQGCPPGARNPVIPPGNGGDGGGDRQAPGLRVSAPRRQRGHRTRSLRVSASCDEACQVTVTGRLTGGVRRRLAGTRRRLNANSAVRLRVRLSRSAARSVRRALRRGRSVRASITVEAVDAAGNARRVTSRVSLVR